MLAFVVGLVLAVWGLLRLRAVPGARPDHTDAGEAPCAPSLHAETNALAQTISRDAVRRSCFFASRAPGPLQHKNNVCERAFVSILRCTRTIRGARTFRSALHASRDSLRAVDVMRMTVLPA